MDNNFLKEKFNDFRYRIVLKNFFDPNKEFLQKTRILFLSKLTGEVVTKIEFQRIHHRELIWRYAFSIFLITFLISGGLVIYADTQNVNVGHPLYQVKRTGEKIQFVFSSSSQEPFLYQKFAERRLSEIKIMEAKSVTLTEAQQAILEELNFDLDDAVYLAIENTNNPNFPEAKIIILCNEIVNMMKEYEFTMPQNSLALQNFKDHCRDLAGVETLLEINSGR